MVEIFNAVLTTSFVPGTAFLIQADTITLDFTLVLTNGPVSVAWYPEFATGNPNDTTTPWFRELAEEDVGSGVVNMPKTVRVFQENGGAALATGTHQIDAQLVRRHQFCRIQMRRVTADPATAQALVVAPFGLKAA